MTLVAIHQPNFFPWLGYFDKIARADVFVFLDGVDFPKNSWVNRARLNIQGKAQWTTCPIQRATASGPIHEVQIDDAQDWRTKLRKTLDANYRRAPHFDAAMAMLEPLVGRLETSLAAFNINAIVTISASLGVDARFVKQTELDATGAGNDLLAAIVRAAGGSHYLIGGGADGYHDPAVFGAAGIKVVEQGFVPQPYGPAERFLPGLSVIDYLMYDGRKLSGGNGRGRDLHD